MTPPPRRAWTSLGSGTSLDCGPLDHVAHPALYLTRYERTADGSIAEHRTVLGFFKSDATAELFAAFLDDYTSQLNRKRHDTT